MKKRFAHGIAVICLWIASFSIAHAGGAVLFIDSYHEGYFWSDMIRKGVMDVFAEKGGTVTPIHMDTKRNTSEAFKKAAGVAVRDHIEAHPYDVVIAADDNASKYVIMPFYKNADLPVVFCGVNWDASVYGYPYANATGMVEVSPIQLALKHLRPLAGGDRIAILLSDHTTGRKNLESFKQILKMTFAAEAFVSTFEDWKQNFLDLQTKADMLFLSAPGGIAGWDDAEAERFILSNARIPIGTDEPEYKRLALLGVAKIPEEHGEYAAALALKILAGASPSDFPVVKSKRGDLVLNMKIAQKLGIRFPFELVKMARPENIIR
jgi:ABC-type uncharacterized transport system substrate-binding protein